MQMSLRILNQYSQDKHSTKQMLLEVNQEV